jgi:hypothetical protein
VVQQHQDNGGVDAGAPSGRAVDDFVTGLFEEFPGFVLGALFVTD